MIKKLTIGNLRLTFSMARIQKVVGVNSRLPDGKHILMWDFDDTKLLNVVAYLSAIQQRYRLPTIYVLRSSPPDNYIAYCFKRVEWIDAVRVVANTQGVDYNFLKYGVYRGRFTLRVSAKKGYTPRFATCLPSTVKPDCFVNDLQSWVRYETLMGGI